MSGITDRMDLGYFPLQDFSPKVPLSVRQSLGGARITKMTDPRDASSGAELMIEYGRDEGLGTLGDVHPWLFWQTRKRDVRGMGAWAQLLAGIIVTGGAGGDPTTTSSGGGGAVAQPIRTRDVTSDPRFTKKMPGWPGNFPALPRGTLVAVAPGTEETEQHTVLLHVDPRLVAPDASGPREAGTLIVDLQPDGELCMASNRPGTGGRHALLQSLVRVVAMPADGAGNQLALNFTRSAQGGLPGLGAVFAKLKGGSGGPTTGGGSGGPITGSGPGDVTALSASLGGNQESAEGLDGADEEGFRAGDTGAFAAKRRSQCGVAYMADEAFGPLSAGHEQDQHRAGVDRDGHPINAGHIGTDAYIFRNKREDGPYLFEGDYPDPPPWPLTSRVHLSWDPKLPHVGGMGKWRWWAEVPYLKGGGPPTGNPPVIPPTTPGPRPPGGPTTPGTPGPATPGPAAPKAGKPATPGPGGPATPGPAAPGSAPARTWPITPPAGPGKPPRGRGTNPVPVPLPGVPVPPVTPGGGSQAESPGGRPPGLDLLDPKKLRTLPGYPGGPGQPGSVGKVGSTRIGDVGNYSILHPFHTAFAAVAFRPQKWIDGGQSFEHNPDASAEDLVADEETRPQVLAARAWGAQSASGDWDYTDSPHESRARGGRADGGLLFSPPQFELEDYFGLGVPQDVHTITGAAFIAAAPGVAFALGTPTTAGGMDLRSVIVEQVAEVDNANTPFRLSVVDSAGAAQSMIAAELDQTTSERVVSFAGTSAIVVPVGTTAQRPSALLAAGAVRVNTSGANDVLEFWDSQGSAWVQVGSGGAGVTDHGALTGLADDDHTQYSKADGTRAFSAVVSGVTPTAAAHLATKGYVDDGFQPLATNLTAWVALIASLTEGDLFFVDEDGHLAKLAIGTLGQVLTVDNASGSLLPSWQTP